MIDFARQVHPSGQTATATVATRSSDKRTILTKVISPGYEVTKEQLYVVVALGTNALIFCAFRPSPGPHT
ncbi:hypothetical protein L596_018778 [Steinernema carpocapsae]|uniref:Uncharacterized protein n=1 Tax=Steinernema carpocapsae TaxID=34508 RepID=A0A4U5N670_STECR|nr:hypothetical protein L596_018778 [Steinernema carpocapsae]